MPEQDKGINAEIDALIAELFSADAEYPLPEQKPVKYTNVDIVVMPRGYKSEYPKPKEGDAKPSFTDSIAHLELDSVEEADGVLKVPVTIANSSHIYDYDGFKVCKPFDELKAAAIYADGIPVTCEHPSGGIVTDRAQVLGFLRNPIAENDELKGLLEITGKDLIADIKSGKLTDVSSGFFCDLDSSESGQGEIEGDHYDATQRKIFLNHVAVCEQGRCSRLDGCGLNLDAKKTPVPQSIADKIAAAIERAKAMKDKSLLKMLEDLKKAVTIAKDAKDGKVEDPLALKKVKDALDALKAERDAATSERDSLKAQLEGVVKAEKDALIAELTSLQDAKGEEELGKLKLDQLKKELDMVKQIKANRLSVDNKGQSTGRKSIDDAYANIGKKGGK